MKLFISYILVAIISIILGITSARREEISPEQYNQVINLCITISSLENQFPMWKDVERIVKDGKVSNNEYRELVGLFDYYRQRNSARQLRELVAGRKKGEFSLQYNLFLGEEDNQGPFKLEKEANITLGKFKITRKSDVY